MPFVERRIVLNGISEDFILFIFVVLIVQASSTQPSFETSRGLSSQGDKDGQQNKAPLPWSLPCWSINSAAKQHFIDVVEGLAWANRSTRCTVVSTAVSTSTSTFR